MRGKNRLPRGAGQDSLESRSVAAEIVGACDRGAVVLHHPRLAIRL